MHEGRNVLVQEKKSRVETYRRKQKCISPAEIDHVWKEKKRKDYANKVSPQGIPLFAWIKEEIYIWCKHQANLHHQTRKKVISGGREGSEKSHMFFPWRYSTSYLNLWSLLRIE